MAVDFPLVPGDHVTALRVAPDGVRLAMIVMRRPVVVLADNLTDGYLRRVFEAGAEDAISLSAEPEEIGFSLQKVLARRQGATTGSGGTTGSSGTTGWCAAV